MSLVGTTLLLLGSQTPLLTAEVRTTIGVLVRKFHSITLQFDADTDTTIDVQWSNDGFQYASDVMITYLGGSGTAFVSSSIRGIYLRYVLENTSGGDGTVLLTSTFASFFGQLTGEEGPVGPIGPIGPIGDIVWQETGVPGPITILSPQTALINLNTDASNSFTGVGVRQVEDCSILSSFGCTIAKGSGSNHLEHSSIIACSGCLIEGQRSDFTALLGCEDCTWFTAGGLGGANGLMASCLDTTHNTSRFDTVLSCDDLASIGQTQTNTFNTYLSLADLINMPSGAGMDHSVVAASRDFQSDNPNSFGFYHGRNIRVGVTPKNGMTILADDRATGGQLIPPSSSFWTRFDGGYVFYSNDALTAGVTLAGGASAWAPICDVNKKENIVAVDTGDILAKALLVPVNTYNYKFNDPAIVCIGPTAQDWHAQFGCDDMNVPLYDTVAEAAYYASYDHSAEDPPSSYETAPVIRISLLDGNGDPMFGTKPAKDPLTIESMDLDGVLLASIQELHKIIVLLTARIVVLEAIHNV